MSKIERDWNEVYREMKENFKNDCIEYGWLNILNELTILTRSISSYKAGRGSTKRDFCPNHGGRNGDKFVLLPGAEQSGAGYCYKCGETYFGMNIVMLSNKVDFKEAVRLIKSIIYTNGAQPYPWQINPDNKYLKECSTNLQPSKEEVAKSEELTDWEKKLANRRRAENRKLLCESVSIFHDSAKPLRDYFISRAIDTWGDFGDSLRFNPSVKYTEKVPSADLLKPFEVAKRNAKLAFLRGHRFYISEFTAKSGDIFCDMGEHPAALFIMRNNNSLKATSIQRIYLSHDGKKMELDGHHDISIKKRTPRIPGVSLIGSSCHIDHPAMKVIGVAEGPETTLAIRSCIGLPMNITMDSGGLGNWRPNDSTDRVIIFKDKDISKAGDNAAEKLQKRLQEEFIEAIIVEPPLDIPEGEKSMDFQTAVEILGKRAFPEWLINWQTLDV